MNASDLKAKLAEIFCCVDGPPRAYFELPMAAPIGPDTPILRVVYTTVIVAIRGESDLVESVLCDWAWAKFHELLTEEARQDQYLVLFWRRHPAIEGFSDEKGCTCTRLRMRLAIPGIDLSDIAHPEGKEARWL